jgi:2,4-dichlorophenol 6-monooxygenase
MSNSAFPAESDVLIVGGGPAGMVTAALLERLGLTVRILERFPSRLELPKAHVVGPVTLDICQQAGLDVDRMIAEALPAEWDQFVRFHTRLFGELLGTIAYEHQSPEWTARPRINLSQPRFEGIAEEGVRTRTSVEWVCARFTGAQVENGRVVSTATVDDRQVQFSSRYLIGADGANSAVRECLGISMHTYGEPSQQINAHVVADMREQLADDAGVLYALIDPEVVGAVIVHGLGNPSLDNQIEFICGTPYDGETVPEMDTITERVRKVIGRDDIPFEVRKLSPWVLTARVADQFQAGPCFLIGDAAHRLPPTGGLGMNTAIQDGANLAWKLAAVIHGWADEALLETYSVERRPIAIANTLRSRENFDIHVQALAKLAQAAYEGTLQTMPREQLDGLVQQNAIGFNSPGLQLGYGYGPDQEVHDATTFTPSADIGRRLPHVQVNTGTARPIIDLVDVAGFTIFVRGLAAAWRQTLNGSDFPVTLVDITAGVTDDAWLELTGLAHDGAALVVRPDGHIAARAAGPESWPGIQDTLRNHIRFGRALGTEEIA